MSKFFLFSRFNNNKKKDPNINNKWYSFLFLQRFNLGLLSFSVIIFLFFGYIFLVNNTSNSGFILDDLEKRLTEAEKQNETLELKLHNNQSMVYIKEVAAENKSLVVVEKPEYLETSKAVALNE